MKFPWVLFFDLGISNFQIVAHNFAEFPGVEKLVFSRISKGNVTNLKFSKGAFQKSIPTPPPPTYGSEFFWNSPITDRWVSSKKSNYYNRGMAVGTTLEKISNKGEGWTPEISWGYIEKLYCRTSRGQLKKELAITIFGPESSMGYNTIFPGLRSEASFCLEFLEWQT